MESFREVAEQACLPPDKLQTLFSRLELADQELQRQIQRESAELEQSLNFKGAMESDSDVELQSDTDDGCSEDQSLPETHDYPESADVTSTEHPVPSCQLHQTVSILQGNVSTLTMLWDDEREKRLRLERERDELLQAKLLRDETLQSLESSFDYIQRSNRDLAEQCRVLTLCITDAEDTSRHRTSRATQTHTHTQTPTSFLQEEEGFERLSWQQLEEEERKQLQRLQRLQSAKTSFVTRMLEEKQTLERRLEDSRVCVVCQDRPIAMLFKPCNHLLACSVCTPKLQCCPLCRANILAWERIYLGGGTT
eukprot:GILJ01004859.1.p1 GENE.GILJ01004859.1~~GILJ01004859.1.p1  ORF type:complete len:309 (+),score=46.88 GILJ01004859.1:245-1171(+)